MDYYSIEFVSVIIFLVGLIVMYNIRFIIESQSKESFRNIAVGISIMAICSTASVLAKQNMFQQVPFLNENLFFQLTYWIGMITGMTMLLNGISNWLPIYRKHIKVNSQEIQKLELFKKVEQLIRFENRNNVILLQVLDFIVNKYDLDEVGCYLYSNKDKCMTFLGASQKEDNSDIKSQSIHFHNSAIAKSIENNSIELIHETEQQNQKPYIILPMIAGDKLLGAFTFYTDADIGSSSITNLKLIIDILASKLYQDSLNLQSESIKQMLDWDDKIESLLDNTKPIKTNIVTLKKLLKTKMPVDYITIAFPLNSDFSKISVYENNQVLEDFTVSFTETNELEKYVLDNNLPVIIDNLGFETNFIVDLNALQNDMRSIAAYPVSNSTEQVGVIVVGSKSPKAFTKSNLKYIESLNNKIERLISKSVQRSVRKKENTRRRSIHGLLRKTTANRPTSQVYQSISDYLLKELKASFTRISLFDQDKRFLNSQVMSSSENFTFMTPQDASMMLTLMPNHRKVLQLRETVSVSLSEMENEDAINEQRQIFGDTLSQYVISPIFDESLIVGVISIGYTDQTASLKENDINFIEDTATILSVHNKIKNQSIRIYREENNLQDSIKTYRNKKLTLKDSRTTDRISKNINGELVGN